MKKWKLDPKDVSTGGHGGTSSCPGSKHGPRLKSGQIVLVHLPTRIQVSKNIMPVIASKKQWKKVYQETWDQLFVELEQKVAQYLKLPGR